MPPISGNPVALVTGGNGFVGSHLVERLLELGFRVRLLLRQTSDRRFIHQLDYQEVTGDLRQPDQLNKAVAGVDYIFHSAGLVKADSLDTFMLVNAGGTEKLLNAAAISAPNLTRFVLISSQAAAGPCADKNCKNECDPTQPVSDYGKSKLAGEQVTRQFQHKLPITIIRPPAVFGPRDTQVFEFFRAVCFGFKLKFGRAETFVSLAYVTDLVEGIIAAALHKQAAGEIFFINSVDQISSWQVQDLMAVAMKVETKSFLIPLPLLKIAGSLIGAIERSLGKVPTFSRDKAEELSQRFWISSSQKAVDLLGYKPLHSIESALENTYNWYRKQRWL